MNFYSVDELRWKVSLNFQNSSNVHTKTLKVFQTLKLHILFVYNAQF